MRGRITSSLLKGSVLKAARSPDRQHQQREEHGEDEQRNEQRGQEQVQDPNEDERGESQAQPAEELLHSGHSLQLPFIGSSPAHRRNRCARDGYP